MPGSIATDNLSVLWPRCRLSTTCRSIGIPGVWMSRGNGPPRTKQLRSLLATASPVTSGGLTSRQDGTTGRNGPRLGDGQV
jgi:hypothetical protein